ncbi:globin domain-containing protein [Spirillospora sp. NPDC052269]
MSLEPRIVKESFGHIEPHGAQAVAYFYGRLFAENPRLRTLFPPAMDLQQDRLFHALTTLVWSLDSPGAMTSYLSRLGRGHRRFGVRPEHFPALRSALLATLRRFSGRAWSPEAEAAWAAAFDAAAQIMIAAAEQDAEQAPPWWVAEVVEHERRTPDIAVLTLRPGEPLRFEAGQHVTVQTARWPRVWRTYSVANAPRPDGLLRLHVRAVPGGWVSGALVRHTGTGDTLLLGPALGDMTPPADPGRALLLVAGGTGLAPLRAIVDQAAAAGRHRETHLLLAARTERDLYDLPALRRLEESCPWLHVVPVLSDAPEHAPRPEHGTTPERDVVQKRGLQPERGTAIVEALERLGDLSGHEVYLAGPAGMIRSTTAGLQRLGVPPEHIHHELREAERQEEALHRTREHAPSAVSAASPVVSHTVLEARTPGLAAAPPPDAEPAAVGRAPQGA